ncbi:hypothetical protein AB0O20_34235 [Streptomyces kronopolitis]|uniref:hypothetical protein n=1 Tax=Streptomyces kronopolitis TaxID=1612435 RepID=UPI003432DE22
MTQQPQPQAQATRPQTTYRQGDFVLFRDPERYWQGKPGHTYVCRVTRGWQHAHTGQILYDLHELSGNRHLSGINPGYMRLLPPADAMADIDTAPLSEPDSGAMTPAAVAWLRQHLALPAQR